MRSRTFTSVRHHARHVHGRAIAEVVAEAGNTDEVDAPLAPPAVD